MTINMTFNNTQEMQDFARFIAGVTNSTTEPVFVPAQSARPEQPTTKPVSTPDPAPRFDYDKNPAPINTTPIIPSNTTPTQTVPVGEQPAAQQQVPTAQINYQPDDLARAAMTLMDSGRQGDLIQLLGTFGVASLPDLRPEQYGAFATALRDMGAKI